MLIVLVSWAPFRVPWAITVGWSRLMVRAGDLLCGLKIVVEGRENIPDTPSVIMIKHTTALEAYWQIKEFPRAAWVVKRELFWVPFLGWALKFALAAISINRDARSSAVRQIIEQGVARLADGVWVTSGRDGACASSPASCASVLGRRSTLRGSRRRKRPGSCRTGSKRRCSKSALSTKTSNGQTVTRPRHRTWRRRPLPTTGSGNESRGSSAIEKGPASGALFSTCRWRYQIFTRSSGGRYSASLSLTANAS